MTVEMDVARCDNDELRAEFKFAIGTCVTHVTGDFPGVVVEHAHTSNGLEVYQVHSVFPDDEIRTRIVLGSALRPIDKNRGDCANCILSVEPADDVAMAA